MPQEPKSLKPRSRFKVLIDLWKSIDTKTDRLMSLLSLLDWMKQETSELGERLLEALSLITEELRLLRALRIRQEETEQIHLEQLVLLRKKIEVQNAQQERVERKLDAISRTLQMPMT